MNDRRGFTLVELMIVALLGSLVVMAAYNVLIANQETYRVQNSKTQVQQSTRAAMDILFNELREVSVGGGDILDFDADEIEFRAMKTMGVVCEVDMGWFNINPQLTVRKVVEDFAAGDSVFVFADNDPVRANDDVWIQGRITSIDTTRVCTDVNGVDYEAGHMAFTGQMGTFLADTVRTGGLVRSFTSYSYGLMTYDGEDYLGRAEGGGDWTPLVGPLAGVTGRPGLEFEYLDIDGNAATTADEIERVTVIVRSYSDMLDRDGNAVVDSLSASVYLRN